MRSHLFSLLTLALFVTSLSAQPVTELKGHTDKVYSLAFSPDGKQLATAGFDNNVKLWDFTNGKELFNLAGHQGPVYCVAFSPDGKLLASSSADQTIRLWNPADGKFVREIKGHTGIADCIAFSPDSKLLASGSADKTVRLWNPEDGKEVKNLGAHAGTVHCIAFSPDGKLLASGGGEKDNLIKIWDVPGQKELKTLNHGEKTTAHDEPITGLVFLPDNNTLVSVGEDHLVRVWNVGSGMEAKKFGPTVQRRLEHRHHRLRGDDHGVESRRRQADFHHEAREEGGLLHHLHAGRQSGRHRARRSQLLCDAAGSAEVICLPPLTCSVLAASPSMTSCTSSTIRRPSPRCSSRIASGNAAA